jgi:DNA polymerase III delta prime subunit
MTLNRTPFKFLDSYTQEDLDIFFGRDEETQDLYHALSGVKLLLVHGPSGAGKTSLIECGLRNQYSDADWFAITIRRTENLNAAVYQSVNEALEEKFETQPDSHFPLDQDMRFGAAIERLFEERFQPVYLLFDQFEELLISGEASEKKEFFQNLDRLVRYKVPCRILLIMREEFIGHLSEFESLCPSIFQHRFRLEKMRTDTVRKALDEMLEAERFKPHFTVENKSDFIQLILSKLPDKNKEIELAHVQVFLAELLERALEKDADSPVLRTELIKEGDNLTTILDTFLEKQLRELDESFGENKALEVLSLMISDRSTKIQIQETELQKDLDKLNVRLEKPLSELLDAMRQRKIVRELRQSDHKYYEISHDVLAEVVGRRITDEMRQRRRAEDTYKLFQEFKGLYSREQIVQIRSFEEALPLPKALKHRIEESEAAIIQAEQKELIEAQTQAEKERELKVDAEHARDLAKNRTRYAWIAAGFAIILAVAAFFFAQNAAKKSEEAKNNLIQNYQSEIKRFRNEVKTTKSNLDAYTRYGAGDDVKNLEVLKRDSLLEQIDSLKKEISKLNQ